MEITSRRQTSRQTTRGAGYALLSLIMVMELIGCGKPAPENPADKANAHLSGEKLEEKQLQESGAAQPPPANSSAKTD